MAIQNFIHLPMVFGVWVDDGTGKLFPVEKNPLVMLFMRSFVVLANIVVREADGTGWRDEASWVSRDDRGVWAIDPVDPIDPVWANVPPYSMYAIVLLKNKKYFDIHQMIDNRDV